MRQLLGRLALIAAVTFTVGMIGYGFFLQVKAFVTGVPI